MFNYEKNFRKIGLLITSILSILCMIYPARYLFDKDNFAANKVIEAKLMALNVIPWIVGIFVIFAAYLVLYTNSIKTSKPIDNKNIGYANTDLILFLFALDSS